MLFSAVITAFTLASGKICEISSDVMVRSWAAGLPHSKLGIRISPGPVCFSLDLRPAPLSILGPKQA